MKKVIDWVTLLFSIVLLIISLPFKIVVSFIDSLDAILNGSVEEFFKEKEYRWTVFLDAANRIWHNEKITNLSTQNYTMKDGTKFILKKGIDNGKSIFEILEEK